MRWQLELAHATGATTHRVPADHDVAVRAPARFLPALIDACRTVTRQSGSAPPAEPGCHSRCRRRCWIPPPTPGQCDRLRLTVPESARPATRPRARLNVVTSHNCEGAFPHPRHVGSDFDRCQCDGRLSGTSSMRAGQRSRSSSRLRSAVRLVIAVGSGDPRAFLGRATYDDDPDTRNAGSAHFRDLGGP